MIRSQKSRDLELAYKLQQQDHCFGLTENAVLPRNNDKENYKPRTLIDQTLELLDPTPNIHTLFVQFNERFFSNVLLPVEVKWSPRMTSCAGVCTFHPRNRQCVISLSAPLLKLRPRKDLVETLLHEMIHGYLFLTNNNRDRDGHGPEFCKHMDRINKAAGTKITIYHSFHEEVRIYQQHWWRCNGPCQKRGPYFGTVRRAMNRAPGPSDFWWKEHQQTCGGQFIKIKEPENFKAKSTKGKEKVKPPPKSNTAPNSMFAWLIKTPPPINGIKSVPIPKNTKVLPTNPSSVNGFKELGTTANKAHVWGAGASGSSSNSKNYNGPSTPPVRKSIPPPMTVPKLVSTPTKTKAIPSNQASLNGLIKLGNSTNNVHGWGIGGPGSSSNSQKHESPSTKTSSPKFSSSGVLGGHNTGRSNLLNKLYSGSQSQGLNKHSHTAKIQKPIESNKQLLNEVQMKLVECPVCNKFVSSNDINKHVDSCLTTTDKAIETAGDIATKSYNKINSPKATGNTDNSPFSQKRKSDAGSFSSKQPKLDELENSRKANCPICNKNFDFAKINEHLDACLSGTGEEDDKNENMNDSIVSISSASSDLSPSPNDDNSKNLYPTGSEEQNTNAIGSTSHSCLVCNQVIPSGTSLNEHLEDCIGNVFDDDSSLSINSEDAETSDMVSEISIDDSNKYPCPVCMQLITESVMNEHLDSCLSST